MNLFNINKAFSYKMDGNFLNSQICHLSFNKISKADFYFENLQSYQRSKSTDVFSYMEHRK